MAIPRQHIQLPAGSITKAVSLGISGKLWTGDAIAAFEEEFAALIGVPSALAVPSGRAGLKCILDALELEPGAEIICASFGYPVVPWVVQSLGFSLQFADCEMTTLGMDPEALEQAITPNTKAVIATHLYGVPCQIDRIAEIARANGAVLIEDCAHICGGGIGDTNAGAFGDAAYFSFETSKPINTMGGGMITLSNEALAERAREGRDAQKRPNVKWLMKRLATTGFEATVTSGPVFNLGVYPALRFLPRGEGDEDSLASGYDGDAVSLAGKMGLYTNYQANLGRPQLAQVEAVNAKRCANANRLINALKDRVHMQVPAGPDVRPNYMLTTALFPNMHEMAKRLLKLGVDSKHHYMRDCTFLLEDRGDFPNAAKADREILHLPAFPGLSSGQIDRVAEAVLQAISL